MNNINLGQYVYSPIDKYAFFKVVNIWTADKMVTIEQCDNLQGQKQKLYKVKINTLSSDYI